MKRFAKHINDAMTYVYKTLCSKWRLQLPTFVCRVCIVLSRWISSYTRIWLAIANMYPSYHIASFSLRVAQDAQPLTGFHDHVNRSTNIDKTKQSTYFSGKTCAQFNEYDKMWLIVLGKWFERSSVNGVVGVPMHRLSQSGSVSVLWFCFPHFSHLESPDIFSLVSLR